VKHAQMGDDCVLEEISVLYPSRRAMSSESVGISQVFDIIRKKRLIIYANTPMALSADKTIRGSANAMIQTYKIIKGEKVVLSRFWKLQPNFLSGKVYFHKFIRNGNPLDFMYTKMPQQERWNEYEKKKDNFIDETYSKLHRIAEMKRDKEMKELGFAPIVRKPLTARQKQVMELLAYNNQTETGVILGLATSSVRDNKVFAEKKGYKVSEFLKSSDKEIM
ncbi:MAG: hypothetical protein KAQ92_03980, partial [Candidatus Aenigmarchaeota archaeon]|nr:hypothetical protein [Candidatus Aenigmarchaeota archaeon]